MKKGLTMNCCLPLPNKDAHKKLGVMELGRQGPSIVRTQSSNKFLQNYKRATKDT